MCVIESWVDFVWTRTSLKIFEAGVFFYWWTSSLLYDKSREIIGILSIKCPSLLGNTRKLVGNTSRLVCSRIRHWERRRPAANQLTLRVFFYCCWGKCRQKYWHKVRHKYRKMWIQIQIESLCQCQCVLINPSWSFQTNLGLTNHQICESTFSYIQYIFSLGEISFPALFFSVRTLRKAIHGFGGVLLSFSWWKICLSTCLASNLFIVWENFMHWLCQICFISFSEFAEQHWNWHWHWHTTMAEKGFTNEQVTKFCLLSYFFLLPIFDQIS